MTTEDPTPEELQKDGRLSEVETWLREELDRARELETHLISEVDKYLWLANAGAATVSIGYITTAKTASYLQFFGCTLFIVAIICLLVMKLVGETNASRDRSRRQAATNKFFKENLKMSTLGEIRDSWFTRLAWSYKTLKATASVLFIAGSIFTLLGVYPNVTTQNKALNSQPSAAGTPQSSVH